MGDFIVWMQQTQLSVFLRESGSVWGFPLVLFMHTAGLALLVGSSVVVNARMLGVGSELPLAPLESLFPIMWTGFWLNAVSGTILLMASDPSKLLNPLFYIKMAFIAVAVWLMTREKKQLFGEQPRPAPRWLAVLSLVCWFGAIVTGRLLAYYGKGTRA